MAFAEEKEEFKCWICLRSYHDPIILPCGHTFDRICIEKMILANQSYRPVRPIKCPLCSFIFDPKKPLISNKSICQVMQCDLTFEWFLIDIHSSEQIFNVLTFLRNIFEKREVFDTNHIIFVTEDERITFDMNIEFDKQLPSIKSIRNLDKLLQETCLYLQKQNGLRKIYLLIDGYQKHSNRIRIDSNIIHQRLLIQIGDKNTRHTRKLAEKLNFIYGFFTEKTLEYYVEHFLQNF